MKDSAKLFKGCFKLTIILTPLIGSFLFAQKNYAPQMLGADYARSTKKIERFLPKSGLSKGHIVYKETIVSKESQGATFTHIAFDKTNSIQELSRSTTKIHLNRALIGELENTNSYYYTKLAKNNSPISSHYVQLISDSKWDRVLYGSLNGTLKEIKGLSDPGEIEVNTAGQVFIAERGKKRIQVMHINRDDVSATITPEFTIETAGEVTALAYNDGGTPFNMQDDHLFVADAGRNVVKQYKLLENSASFVREYSGFRWPVAITSGRMQGAHTNTLYIVDNYAKTVGEYILKEGELERKNIFTANSSETFTQVTADHFGHIYLAEGVNNRLYKLTADLQLLAEEKVENSTGVNDLHIPFGVVDIEGEVRHWTGFNQLFSLESWDDKSGVKRFELGIGLENHSVSITEKGEEIVSRYTLTDYAETSIRVLDAHKKEVYFSGKEWQKSGRNHSTWNRTTKEGAQLAPGYYELVFSARSAYNDKNLTERTAFYLPLYYKIEADAEIYTAALTRLQGEKKERVDGQYLSDKEQVVYQVSGLNPKARYAVSALYPKVDEQDRWQEIWVDGAPLDHPVQVNETLVATEQIEIPASAFEDGIVTISIKRMADAVVAVKAIEINELGTAFNVEEKAPVLPNDYLLEQNYPNPFNPVTQINFYIPEKEQVTLTVYDMVGKQVTTLVNSALNAGQHSVQFNAGNLASGLYFYQLKAGRFSETKKMLLVK